MLNELDRNRIIRRMIGLEVQDLSETTHKNIQESGVGSVEELQQLPYNVIGFSDEMKKNNRELKDFLYQNLYQNHRVIRMQVKAENIIKELFQAYHREPLMLPEHIQPWIEERGLDRAICDYIAGMTDRYAMEEYEKLFNPRKRP